MSAQRPSESNQSDSDRHLEGRDPPATPGGSVAHSTTGSISPAPAGPRAEDADRRESAFSIATICAVIALAACGAAAVAAAYGPVFTQPLTGP